MSTNLFDLHTARRAYATEARQAVKAFQTMSSRDPRASTMLAKRDSALHGHKIACDAIVTITGLPPNATWDQYGGK